MTEPAATATCDPGPCHAEHSIGEYGYYGWVPLSATWQPCRQMTEMHNSLVKATDSVAEEVSLDAEPARP